MTDGIYCQLTSAIMMQGDRMNFLNELKRKLLIFMRGRYGHDELNKVILILYLIVALLFYFQEHLLWLMLMITFGSFYVFRSLSKDIFARSKENQQYLNLKNKVLSFFSQDKLSHKQFICPNCKQKVRVPSGRGKIEITCPKCHHKFTKRS